MKKNEIVNTYLDHTVNQKLFNKRLKQIKILKYKYKINCLLGRSHIKFLREHEVFGLLGNNVIFQPDKIPNNSKLVKIHNNVTVASNVTFFEHDVINMIFEKMDNKKYISHLSCIEIYDNCFIGGGSIIVGNCKIGPNAIVAAGSVVIKDVPEGTIVGGNPARAIGKFEDLHNKRMKYESDCSNITLLERYDELWNEFYESK